MNKHNFADLFGTSKTTYYNWLNGTRPIVNFINKYLTDEDIEEYLKTGNCTKFDKVVSFSFLKQKVLEENLKKFNSFFIAYGDEFAHFCKNKSKYEDINKYRLFFDEYYNEHTYFGYFFDDLKRDNFALFFSQNFDDLHDDLSYLSVYFRDLLDGLIDDTYGV